MLRLALTLALVLLSQVALAKTVPTCKSPRNAVEAVFVWQSGKQQSVANAARCFERSGRTQPEVEELARRLKTLFDAEGVIVHAEKLSDDPEHLDADKNPTLVVTDRFPRVSVEKRDGRWVWTRESLDWIEDRYEDRLGLLDKAIDRIPEPLRTTFAEVALWQYAAFLVMLLVGGLVAQVLRAVVRVWLRRADAAAPGIPSLARRFLDRAGTASSLAVSALFVRLLYPALRLPAEIAASLHVGVRLFLTFAVTLAALRLADVFADGLEARVESTESRLDQHLLPIIRKALKAGAFVLGFLGLLQTFSVDVTALFATLGIGTLAVGLAAKDTLANLFGSISIFVDNPFKIGDWIFVDGADGIVEEVGFRSTRLRTPHNSLVIIPNAKLADSKIDNYGKRRFRRAAFVLHPIHGTPPARCDALCEAIRGIVLEHPHVRQDKVDVALSGIGAPALEVAVAFFFDAEANVDEAREKHAILLAVLERVRELGVTLHAPAPPPVPAAAKPT
ncbi:MAG: mechanosensitive ion channel family protein [Deltaproteobacteria bacterium]|nr:mechanosensitive ion channel family protein [Deltaproteobacteria bacterium]